MSLLAGILLSAVSSLVAAQISIVRGRRELAQGFFISSEEVSSHVQTAQMHVRGEGSLELCDFPTEITCCVSPIASA
jgi:hypothetical protein